MIEALAKLFRRIFSRCGDGGALTGDGRTEPVSGPSGEAEGIDNAPNRTPPDFDDMNIDPAEMARRQREKRMPRRKKSDDFKHDIYPIF